MPTCFSVSGCLLRSEHMDANASDVSPLSTYSSARLLHHCKCSARVIFFSPVKGRPPPRTSDGGREGLRCISTTCRQRCGTKYSPQPHPRQRSRRSRGGGSCRYLCRSG